MILPELLEHFYWRKISAMSRSISIPEPATDIFRGGIRHPELLLWDAWSHTDYGKTGCNHTHLYCLAVNRRTLNGELLSAKDRNNYHFHIRHFVSHDEGASWFDNGAFQRADAASDGHDSRNIWSGSTLAMSDGNVLAAYTGIEQRDEERPFVQNLAAAVIHDSDRFPDHQGKVLLCPIRDEQKIRSAGYFIAANPFIGHGEGEEGGPILAWRDPFVLYDADNAMQLVWAAKASAKKSALGLATVSVDQNQQVRVDELHAPIVLPDSHQFSQLELPKIYFDPVKKRYILIVATTTRESELQSDEEVVKLIRLYTSGSLNGEWTSGGSESSVVGGLDDLFGMTVIDANFEQQKLICMAPYTEAVSPDQALSFAPRFTIDLSQIECVEALSAS